MRVSSPISLPKWEQLVSCRKLVRVPQIEQLLKVAGAAESLRPSAAMSSNQWYPASKWSESLRVYELLAIFRYEADAREWERGAGLRGVVSTRPSDPELRNSKWARKLLGYKGKSSSAFWQFVYSSGVPHIRLNSRRIMFSEIAVFDWLEKRSVGRVR